MRNNLNADESAELSSILSNPKQLEEEKATYNALVNRLEAVKQLIERVNRVIKKEIIVDEYNIESLKQVDTLPTIHSGKFDQSVDTYAEIVFVGTANVKQAVLTPIWKNGRLDRVEIADPGRGYKVPPTYEFAKVGNGRGAELIIT